MLTSTLPPRSTTKRSYDEAGVLVLLREYAAHPTPLRLNSILVRYPSLVRSVARRYVSVYASEEDLVQEGTVGLIRAVERWDEARARASGVRFSTFANRYIVGAILHYLRDRCGLIRQPAWIQERTQQIEHVQDNLLAAHNRPPTLPETACGLRIDQDSLLALMRLRQATTDLLSLEAPEGCDGTASAPDATETMHQRLLLAPLLARLSERERRTLTLAYAYGCTMPEVAQELGISTERATYLKKRGLSKLRQQMGRLGLTARDVLGP